MQSPNSLILRCGAKRSLEGRTTLLQAALCLGLAQPALAEGIPRAELKSGFEQMGPQSQGMQRDDTLNPAMLWVAEGRRLWAADPGTGKPSCAGCHGDAAASMRAAAASHPKIDEASGKPID